jgi:hypothetical protein
MEFYQDLLKINNQFLLKELQKKNKKDVVKYYKENNFIFRATSNNSIQYKIPLYNSLISKYLFTCVSKDV